MHMSLPVSFKYKNQGWNDLVCYKYRAFMFIHNSSRLKRLQVENTVTNLVNLEITCNFISPATNRLVQEKAQPGCSLVGCSPRLNICLKGIHSC